MIVLTTINPHIKPFFGESQNFMVHELLYHGFKNQTILCGVPYVSNMERARHIRVMPVMVGESNMW